jgi:hypothetical protein
VEATLSGIQTVMSAAQTEFVLGIEGCAILENMINIHDAEFREIYSDIGGFAAALLLRCCCVAAALLLLCCCFTAALLLLYCWSVTRAQRGRLHETRAGDVGLQLAAAVMPAQVHPRGRGRHAGGGRRVR